MIKKAARTLSKTISLTFDDGPDGVYTPKILDILNDFGVKATFFLVGKNAKRHPHIVKRIYSEGHDIGNHTYTHPVSPLLRNIKNKEFIKEEISRTNGIIKDIVGNKPVLFRPTLARWDYSIKQLLNQARQFGHLSVGWSLSSIDWLGNRFIIRQRLLRQSHTSGEIVLLHDGAEKTFIKKRHATVELLPAIIEKCKRESFRLLPLMDALRRNKGRRQGD